MAKVERGEALLVGWARFSNLAPLKTRGAHHHWWGACYPINKIVTRATTQGKPSLKGSVQSSSLFSDLPPQVQNHGPGGNKRSLWITCLTQRPIRQPKSVAKAVDFRDYIGQNEAGNFTPVLVESYCWRLQKKSSCLDVELPWLFQFCHVPRVWNCRYCPTVISHWPSPHGCKQTMNCRQGYSKAILDTVQIAKKSFHSLLRDRTQKSLWWITRDLSWS